MAKRRKPSALDIQDFFGAYNTYHIFALKSELPLFPFVNKVKQTAHLTFSLLSDIERIVDNFSARFSVFCAELAHREQIHFLLLENRAVVDQQMQFKSKTEKKLPFQTGFLFEEKLSIFNNYGYFSFGISQPDIDYLLIVYSKKGIENEVINQILSRFTTFGVTDISYLLERSQTSLEVAIREFLRDFICVHEVKANKFSRRKKLDLLGPVRQIPPQNLQFPVPATLENESLPKNVQISEKYLELLS
ncbi:MAG: hypothetical protein LBI45_00245 [Bacteroidales bacterium]|jgi:hypothetical protein|nr:hypothetical protein [Bacteroidales bacterium]